MYSKKEEENACWILSICEKKKKKDENKVNHIATEKVMCPAVWLFCLY